MKDSNFDFSKGVRGDEPVMVIPETLPCVLRGGVWNGLTGVVKNPPPNPLDVITYSNGQGKSNIYRLVNMKGGVAEYKFEDE
jgi:hypothetical protein